MKAKSGLAILAIAVVAMGCATVSNTGTAKAVVGVDGAPVVVYDENGNASGVAMDYSVKQTTRATWGAKTDEGQNDLVFEKIGLGGESVSVGMGSSAAGLSAESPVKDLVAILGVLAPYLAGAGGGGVGQDAQATDRPIIDALRNLAANDQALQQALQALTGRLTQLEEAATSP